MTTDRPAYAGLRVCDLTQGVAGPHCAFLLAQHGADVIKIEPPGGDWGRGIGKRHGPYSAFFLQVNRGKRSLALDLKQAEARDAAARIAAQADIVLEAFRPGVTARFGLDYESVRAVNPDVIYLSVTGYGQHGPWSDRPLTDSIAQAVTGMMSMNRDKNGLPQRVGMIAIDVMTGLYAFQAVSAALYARTVQGAPGRHIDMSLQQSAGAFMAAKMIEYHLEGPVPQVVGVPVGTFRSADGFVNINAREAFRSALRPCGPAWACARSALRQLRSADRERGRIDGPAPPAGQGTLHGGMGPAAWRGGHHRRAGQ